MRTQRIGKTCSRKAAREQEPVPVGYVHPVFGMPEPLARLALVSKLRHALDSAPAKAYS